MTAPVAPSTRKAPPLAPDARIQFVPGVGPQRAQAFERLGIYTLEDLLRHYPRTYLDARTFVRIKDLRPGRLVTVSGAIQRSNPLRTRGGRADFSATVTDGTGVLGCYFFGQSFLARTLKPGVRVVVSGVVEGLDRQMQNPMFDVVEDDLEQLMHAGRLVPVHALTRGLTARGLRTVVRAALECAGAMEDAVPDTVAAARGLVPLDAALRAIHFPESDAALAEARRRLAFEELFLLQTVLELRRRMLNEAGRGLSTAGPGELARRAEAALPFALTPDQVEAGKEIAADLARPRPMQRLLLGDVGSGKTVVAWLAALHVIEAGHQVAFMAPTEILARQHAATLTALAATVDVPVAVLTGSTPADERRRLAAALESGTPMLAVGTHALLEEKVKIPQLALAIVDEQHRFGVRQRALLAKKTVLPDVLVLTATPIPRTLMLASYGDLDVSRLRARPAGRGRMVTRIAPEEKFPQIVEFMARELAAGRQAFVVVPLIEEGEGQAALSTSIRGHRAAEAEFRQLSEHPLLRAFRIGLLHGRLKPADKQRVMEEFAAGEVHVLVATTVVEVGIDVPNATVMMIENAERFGLTQLHQLRGRVGRGAHRSVCVLIPGPGATPEARERLEVLTRTEDGFEIAEADLALRGPGELWGVRQSGLPRLKIADLARDAALLDEARDAARDIVAADAWLGRDEHAVLKERLLRDYREALELALGG